MRALDFNLAREFQLRFSAQPPSQTVAEWALEIVVFNEPEVKGPVDFTGRNYLIQPLNENNDPTVSRQTFCWGTGNGKTILFMMGMAWKVIFRQPRTLWVMPAEDGPNGTANFANTRMIPMLRASPALAAKIPRDRHKVGGTRIHMNGTVIDFTGSNSSSQLSGNRCSDIRCDEVDKFPTKIKEEAGALHQATTRADGVIGAQIFISSSPSVEAGAVWQSLMASNLQRRFIPCPRCGRDHPTSKNFVMIWNDQFCVLPNKFTDGREIPTAKIKWDDAAKRKDGSWDMDRVVRSARMVCPHCGGDVIDSDMEWCDANGMWLATRAGSAMNKHQGYHLPSLYAPRRDFESTFGGLAKKFLEANASAEGMRGFINSKLAEVDTAQENSSITINTTSFAEPEWTALMSVDFQKLHPYLWFLVQKFCTFRIQPAVSWTDGKPDFVRHLDQSPKLKMQVGKIINGVETAWPALCEILRFDPRTGDFPPLDWLISNGITGEKLTKMFLETCGGKTMDFGNYIFHQMGKRVPKGGDSEITAAGYCELSGDDAWAELKERQIEFSVGAQFEKSGTSQNRAVLIDSGYMESHNPEVLRKCYESGEGGRWWWYRKDLKDFSIYRKDIGDLPAPMDCWIPYKGYPIARRRWQSASGKDAAVHWASDDPFKGLGTANTRAVQLLEGASEWYFHKWMDDRERQKEVLTAIAAHKSYRGNLWSVSADLKLFPEHRFTREDFERQMNARGRTHDGKIWERGTGGAGKRRHPDHLNDCARNMYALAEVHGFFNTEPTIKPQDTK